MLNDKDVTVMLKRIDLCDLMLACTVITHDLERDLRTAHKWRNLHDKLKAALKAFDEEEMNNGVCIEN